MDLLKFTRQGKFLMLAFDHRGSFKKLMNPQNPDAVTLEQQIELKKKIIDSVYEEMSSLLIDQEVGMSAFKKLLESGRKPKPYLMPLEKSGYETQGKERLTTLEKSATQLKQLGAEGAKLLLFFNPYADSATKQIETARKVMEDCRANNLPFFLEPRTYNSAGEEADKMEGEEREKVAVETLKKLVNAQILPDVYKLEYPGSEVATQTYTAILEGTNIPWIMLTMGASYEEFKSEVEIASIRGCQGFLAGRALWQEACSLKDGQLDKFLKETLPQRFREVSQILKSN